MVEKIEIIKYQCPLTIEYFNQYIFKYLKNITCWVAGGAFREFYLESKIEDDTDIDIFFPNIDEYNKAVKILYTGLSIETLSGCLIKVNGKQFHLIKKFFFNSPEDIINDFDFTICSGVVDKENIYLHSQFQAHNRVRLLFINKAYNRPLNTLKRVIKYVRKGYLIPDIELINLLREIQKLDLTNYENEIGYYHDFIKEIKEWF